MNEGGSKTILMTEWLKNKVEQDQEFYDDQIKGLNKLSNRLDSVQAELLPLKISLNIAREKHLKVLNNLEHMINFQDWNKTCFGDHSTVLTPNFNIFEEAKKGNRKVCCEYDLMAHAKKSVCNPPLNDSKTISKASNEVNSQEI